ncbi:hypothetical protein [Catellatospora bangladeshensis]|uniref:Secreted protein n=1 Tax=Catellatospora bangladeshensis TaxID=310355 RepID=A0A8J3JPK8_9ACTN|nr:hypothetical protein [Catellatospora bangladeshensis]GIF81589.1 hypothetical protein Cba03nite_29380 [Catellatospora bangladeshensis]
MTTVLRSAKAAAILAALGLSLGLMNGVAQAGPPRHRECISPIFLGGSEQWRDLNQRYDVRERIIGPPAPATDDIPDPPGGPGCRTALAGEKWVRAVPPWITATQTEQAAFIAGFKSARYVIDAGTAHERSITVGPEILRSGTIPNDVQPPATRGLPYVVPVSPVLRPLRPGTHTSTLFVTMKERVCTGRGPAPGLSADCLEAGESEYPIADNGPFTVLTGPPPPTP